MIFSEIQNYLDKNHVMLIDNVINVLKDKFSKNSFNISTRGIHETVDLLLKKKNIVEGTKYTKEQILRNPRRKRILDYIKRNPGIYKNKILKKFKYGNYVISWHLNVLQKYEFIMKEYFDNRNIYFVPDLDFNDVKKAYILSKEKSKQIIEYILHNNIGITKTHLSRELNMHPYTIKKYLNYLEGIDIIKKEKIKNKCLYFITRDF